ncbi:MAG: phage major capsid protein [Phycisphaeraceae bacterium]
MTLDAETKQMLAELKGALGDAEKMKSAIEQLETQMKNVPSTIDERLKKVRSIAWDPNGRYRGVFNNEDQARGFGLFMVSRCHGKGWAGEALKSEFPEVVRAFESDDAGNLVPEEYTGRIVDLIEQHGVFERNALKVPMSSEIQKYAKRTARMAAAPMDEGASLSLTKPTLSNRSLQARKWGAFVAFSSEVSEDAVAAVGELLAMDMAEAFALAVDQAGFLGDGSGTYNSISGVIDSLISEAIVTPTDATEWDDFTKDHFLEVISKVAQRTFAGNNAKFFCSSQFYWTVMAPLVLAAGGVTAAEMEGRRQLMFLGFPVELTQVLPGASSDDEVCAIFGNLRAGATFGDRRRLNVKQSEHFMFDEDMIAMLGTRRFDINIDGAGVAGDPGTVEVLAALKTDANGG